MRRVGERRSERDKDGAMLRAGGRGSGGWRAEEWGLGACGHARYTFVWPGVCVVCAIGAQFVGNLFDGDSVGVGGYAAMFSVGE